MITCRLFNQPLSQSQQNSHTTLERIEFYTLYFYVKEQVYEQRQQNRAENPQTADNPLAESYEKSQGVRDFLSLIRNYQGITELDATIVNGLIDKIVVSEREKLADGTVQQEIKIFNKFIGFVGELHITPTKRWTALKPKNCTVCGVGYVPRSAISKYCPECRGKKCKKGLKQVMA